MKKNAGKWNKKKRKKNNNQPITCSEKEMRDNTHDGQINSVEY